MFDNRCTVCGSDNVVETGPLSVSGNRAMMRNVVGKQCILCGNLQITVPQALLVRLYPPQVCHLTVSQRETAQWRRKTKRHQRG